MSKVLEQVLNTRNDDYMERHGIYPDAMLSFQARLGTQEAMLLLQREVLYPPGGLLSRDNRTILGQDLQGPLTT